MSVFCITSRRSVGCTFFDWSMHFLSGQDLFYKASQQQWIPLCQDPVQELNAHGHQKNHPAGAAATAQQLDTFLSLPQEQQYSSYPTTMKRADAAKDLGITIEEIGLNSNYQKIVQHIANDFDSIFEICHKKNIPLIYVAEDPTVTLYHINARSLDVGLISDKPYSSVTEAKEDFQKIFFNNSGQTWKDLGLIEIWDQREQQALNSRPLQEQYCNTNAMSHPHLWINCQELWTQGEAAAIKMLNYLQLELVHDRLLDWRPIYAKWQSKQLKALEFCYNYKHIVDCIVNNWYCEIDLTFEQEVIIQHCLIYQHNLNLKTWQLAKFPNNTQDLHKLLEPNIHALGEY